jgi:hypothetical protein
MKPRLIIVVLYLGVIWRLFPGRLEAAELNALLAHELAHVRRRDHWMRLVETGACVLFWWYPAVWWIRRRLRAAEERACDVEVLRVNPGRARAYAEGLLKTLDFLSSRGGAIPALATGASETRQIKERLTMIMKREIPQRLTRLQRWSLALVALPALLVFPTWSQDDGDGAKSPEKELVASAERHREEMIELREKSGKSRPHTERPSWTITNARQSSSSRCNGWRSNTNAVALPVILQAHASWRRESLISNSSSIGRPVTRTGAWRHDVAGYSAT